MSHLLTLQAKQYKSTNVVSKLKLDSVVSSDPPILDPGDPDVRSRNYQMVTLRCTVIRSFPTRLIDIRWFRNGEIIRMPMPDTKEKPELKFKLDPTNNGSYECRVTNSAGTSTCAFNVSGKQMT